MRAHNKPNRWQPTGSDWLTIVALVIAVVVSISPPNWQIGTPVIVVTVAIILIAAIRDRSHPAIRTGAAIALSAYLLWATTPSIWMSFHKDHPNVAFNWPVTFGPSADPVNTPSVPQAPELHLDMLGTNVFNAIRVPGSEKNTGIGIWAKVWNTGAPSVITSWTLTIITAGGRPDSAQNDSHT